MASYRLSCRMSAKKGPDIWKNILTRFYCCKNGNDSPNQGKSRSVAEQRAAKMEEIPSLEEYLKMLADQKEVASRSAIIFLNDHSNLEKVQTVCKRYGSGKLFTKAMKLFVTYNSLQHKKDLSRDLSETDVCSIHFSSEHAKRKWRYQTVRSKKASFNIQSFKEIGQNDFTGHLKRMVELMNMKDHEVLSNFILSNHIDEFYRPNFPDVSTVPHGSVVSGLGCVLSDLDLVVHLFGLRKIDNELDPLSSRSLTQKALKGLKGYLKPDMKRYNLIRGARVPILSFSNHITSSDCDVSISLDLNTSVRTSHIFYSYAHCFECVRPLLYSLKIWARRQGLSNVGIGGHGLSTFGLNHLMLYFLQYMKILPTLQVLHNPECVKKLPLDLSYDTGELYKEFFKFYEKFDFSNTAIDVRDCTLHKDSTYQEQRNFNNSINIINSQSPDLNISSMTNKDSRKLFQKKIAETLSYFANDEPKIAFFKHMNMDGVEGWERERRDWKKTQEDKICDNLVGHATKVSTA